MTTNNIITINLSEEIIPADVIAALHGETETTKQRQARMNLERKERTLQWEANTRANLNTQLIENGRAYVVVEDDPNLYDRKDLVKICKKLSQEFEKKGFTIGGYGEYAATNKKVYSLYITF